MHVHHHLSQTGQKLQQLTKTHDGWFVLLGLLAGLMYLPAWLGYLVPRALQGKIGWFLIGCMLFIAAHEFWRQRRLLRGLRASHAERLLSRGLIIFGASLMPFVRFALWPQALLWLGILVGIFGSLWGWRFFRTCLIPMAFVGLTVYPRIGVISRGLWELVMPDQLLEHTMAHLSSLLLDILGFSAQAQGVYIVLPQGAVEVGWGCNGLDMAITVSITGVLMGILFRQNRYQMVQLVAAAAAISMLFNLPRLILMTLAHVYWGSWWFNFWHGPWGGQVFSTGLLAVYYQVMMAMIERGKSRPSPPGA